MNSVVRVILTVATVAFGLATPIHAGVLISGYEHHKAATAESIIAPVLALGFIATLLWPASIRNIALCVEGFALLGTPVGVFMIVIGIGPRTVFDIVLHALLIAGLVAGLIVTWRSRGAAA